MSKVFVGNFSFSVSDEQLKDYFSKVGVVTSAKVMKEGHGGRSRGFGFVEFANADDALKAIQQLNGSVWEGRVVKVSEDRSNRREDGSYSGGGYGQRSYNREHTQTEGGDNYYQRSSAPPTGYFRAQPLDTGVRKRKKADPYEEDPTLVVDYKDARTLVRFMSERGRILPRRMTGLSAYNQRKVTRSIKRAQTLGLLPYVRQ